MNHIHVNRNLSTNENITHFNVSDEMIKAYVNSRHEKNIKVHIPAITFMTFLAVIGMFGNSLVLLVYWSSIKMSATKIMIMTIAILDLLTNLVIIPGEVYRVVHIVSYINSALCKAHFFFINLCVIASGDTLVAVAIVRYRKICQPFKPQFSVKHGLLFIVFILGLSILCSVPSLIVYGSGYSCFTDDSYSQTIWPLVYQVALFVVFLANSIPLTVMYVLIGIQAWKHGKRHVTSSSRRKPEIPSRIYARPSEPNTSTGTTSPSGVNIATPNTPIQDVSVKSDPTRPGPQETSAIVTSQTKQRKKPVNRVTGILIIITAVYILSYTPYFILMFFFMLDPQTFYRFNVTETMLFQLFVRFLFVNSAANPIIYSICDRNFRQSCLKPIKRRLQ